jgi:Ca2+-binding EF-hand superfamily protein
MRATGSKPASKMSVTLGSVVINVVPQSGGMRYGTEQYLTNLFTQADTAKKGFLTAKQVEGQMFFYLRGLFDLADRNNDGRLTRKELKDYLDLLKSASGSQMSLGLTSTGQGLFQALDVNGDGQLSVREMRNAWNRLAEFDRDGDGCISRTEFPQQFRLTVSDNPNANYFVGQQAFFNPNGMGSPARRSTRGPLWFRKMDRNGDGDVSRSEWLGTKEDFDRIDTDKDGLISVEEAEAFDALTRKKGE